MPTSMHYSFVPTQDNPDGGRVLLRDGSAAEIRPARPDDLALLRKFFMELSPESRHRRFFSASLPSDKTLAELCDNLHPQKQQTLLVLRLRDGAPVIVATGSWFEKEDDEEAAEVAFAVDDRFQGKGLGSLLLERLAILAVRQGYTKLWAVTFAANQAMRNVFRESGFEIEEQLEHGDIEVTLSLTPGADTVEKATLRDRIATVASIRPFFEPRAIAIVGTSRNSENIGHKILRALTSAGFTGPLYPINPKADELMGLKVYPSLEAIPGPVDLAVLAVPPKYMLGVVDEAARKGVRALVVISAGFAEVRGTDGADLQRQLVERVRGHGMRMIGPNCLGILNTERRMNASFSPVFPPAGTIAMSSQSGALGLAVLAAACRLQLGLSTFVSVGNKADVSGNDLIQYWEEDPNTHVILLYLESFGNPRRFASIAQRVSRKKPIIALKAGRGQVGARAASSHTAALASKEVAVDALFRQTGVLRVDSLAEMFDLASALATQKLPTGRRVAILTNAGGPGILCADACEAAGLALPVLTPATQNALRQFLPETASVGNPVDLVASAPPEHYRKALEILLACDEIDSVIVIYIPVGFAENAEYLAAIQTAANRNEELAKGGTPKCLLGCWMYDEQVGASAQAPGQKIPSFTFPETPAQVLGRLVQYADWKQRAISFVPEFHNLDIDGAQHLCQRILSEHGPGWLTLPESFDLLRAFGIPVAPFGLAKTADEAVAFADRFGYPVVLKISTRHLVHKADIGGVRLNLADASAVQSAFEGIAAGWRRQQPEIPLDGVLVQPMVRGGVEVMFGMTRDPAFGPLLAFGLGGVFVEALQDITFSILPLTVADAAAMIRRPKGVKLLKGFRGQPPCDLAALEETLLRLARLSEELPWVQELDMNPILAFAEGKGCQAVDVRIRI